MPYSVQHRCTFEYSVLCTFRGVFGGASGDTKNIYETCPAWRDRKLSRLTRSLTNRPQPLRNRLEHGHQSSAGAYGLQEHQHALAPASESVSRESC